MMSSSRFVSFACVCVAILFLAFGYSPDSLYGAGLNVGDPSMGDSISFPDMNAGWGWNNNSGQGHGSFWMELKGHQLEYSSWNFYVSPSDTSQFYANAYASGWLLNGNALNFADSRQQVTSISRRGVNLNDNLYLSYLKGKTDENGLALEPDSIYLNGGVSVGPAKFTNATFNYQECLPDWEGSDGRTYWYSSCQFTGHFIAPTIAEARAMGAQFATIPEPSTIVLLISGLVTASFAVWRKRGK